ncbi:DUF624 domain-containing protein [Butyrivibrio sp. X503]|uniref:YesL family protein n=1 Tax=Butyrivibrio sp. X503 TaxID=2364878 RepID=UPI000EA964B1|nr:YesL family protein [Butyrivibrio sp. X503]RKM54691.1 DUF624 domain-containing protein [Butyrivibrio sp. X503]
MGRFFDIDSPVMRALTRLADVMWLNILTLIFAIPLIIEQLFFLGPAIGPLMTEGAEFDYSIFLNGILWAWIFGIICSSILGPACTAMHYVLLKMVRDEDSYITKSYFKSFKENFKQGLILQVIKFFVGGMLVLDFFILRARGGVLCYVVLGMAVILYVASLYVFPILSRFENKTRTTIKNSFLMAIIALPRSVAMTVISLMPALLLYFFDLKVLPILILIGVAGPSYVNAMLYSVTFKRFEPEEEELTEEEELSNAIKKLDEE